MRQLYTGIDLHSNNSYVGIIDQKDVILSEMEPFGKEMVSVTTESTFNWYMDYGLPHRCWIHCSRSESCCYAAHKRGLRYSGLKYLDDKHDGFRFAHMDRRGILSRGYIYPKEIRPTSDLLRKRGHLVKLRTSLINSLK